MRSVLVDWMLSIGLKFCKNPKTIFLGINLLNRYLCKKSVSMLKLQALGAACIFLAFKYEEVLLLKAKCLEYLSDEAVKVNDIKEFEYDILSTLDFDILIPNEYDIFELMCIKHQFSEDEIDFGTNLLLLFLLDENEMDYSPTEIVDAICMLIADKYHNERAIEFYLKDVEGIFSTSKDAARKILTFFTFTPLYKFDSFKHISNIIFLKKTQRIQIQQNQNENENNSETHSTNGIFI